MEGLFRFELDGDPDVVASPMKDLFSAGGKRLRPALVLLAADLGDHDDTYVIPAAMAVEITHAATLVHDDVIDRAQLRRGRPTVAASLGNESAIVIGDYYLVKAYELGARAKNAEVVSILARAVMRICAGEVRQQSLRYTYALEEDDYLQWIADKTASLIGACCEIGALLGGLEAQERSALRLYGDWLGMAFQVADDVLDYTASENAVGKPIGHDLVEGFATLPLLIALKRGAVAPIDDGRHIGPEEARRIAELVRDSDAPAAAIARAREFAALARDELRKVPDSEATRTLASLTEYVVSRTF